jgi:acetyl-CoA C-acetyltransferase
VGAVLVGAGQVRNRPELDGPFEAIEPARLMATALERALDDAGVAAEDADFIGTVPPIAWTYDDTPGVVGRMLGTKADDGFEIEPGGDGPCTLLNRVASRIERGEVRVALLAGAESMAGRRRARRDGIEPDWTPRSKDKDIFAGQRMYANPLEIRHGLFAPIQAFPLYENALRAAAGRGIEEHQQIPGSPSRGRPSRSAR